MSPRPLVAPIARTPPPPEAPVPPRGAPRSGRPAARVAGTVAVLLLVDTRPDARLWAWSRLVLGRWPLRHVEGLVFSKVLGSGADGGFGVAPSATHQGLFLVFDGESAARRFVDHSPVVAAYRSHAREFCVCVLQAVSCKGSWSGSAIEPTAISPADGPIAALTRASIRPRRARAFWRHAPAAERSLASAPGCRLAAGLGEAPYLRQATFSLWDSTQAMDAYARSGAHAEAIRHAYAGDYFSETMFVRFVPLLVSGTWKGRRHA